MKKSKLIIASFVFSIGLISQSCGDKTESKEDSSETKVEKQITYKTVQIGDQVWMLENLNLSTFQNGDSIPHAKTNEDWEKAKNEKTPAWCYYNNDSSNGSKYGKLYNCYAANDPRGLAPKGYHLPSTDEVNTLKAFCGGDSSATQLTSIDGWKEYPGYSHTNTSGFTALPTGERRDVGGFLYENETTGFWKSGEYNETQGNFFGLNYDYLFMFSGSTNKGNGYSVRCIKD